MQRLQKFSRVISVASRHLRQLNNNQPTEITAHKTGTQERWEEEEEEEEGDLSQTYIRSCKVHRGS